MNLPAPLHQEGYITPAEGDMPIDTPYATVENGTELVKFPDGSAYIGKVPTPHEDLQINPEDHDQNLASVLPIHVVNKIGYSLKSAIDEDKQSQEPFSEAVAETIELLGLDISSAQEDDLPFTGASTVYSTALFESALDLVASAISSLLPTEGMADCVIRGEATDELKDRAYRKKAFFNFYLTQIAQEFKKESRRTLLWAILCGSCYKKVYIDPSLGRPTSMFIRPEDFIVNRDFATHLTAPRKTHILHISARDLKIRKMSGIYRDIEISEDDGSAHSEQVIQAQLNNISGVESETSDTENLNTSYILYECHVDYYIPEDPLAPQFDIPMPYIITLDSNTGNVLSIRRNWEKDDFLKKKKEYFVNYSLLPSLDGEGYGMVNYAGNLAKSATAITRQLINTGTYANFPGGVYAAGIRIENNNLRPAPGEYVPLQTGGLPIDQTIQSLPYKEPSPALTDLLNRIEDSIRKPSAIINQKVAEMTPRAPMGSVLAMLESMQKIPNAILQGFHESFQQELMLFNDRFADWLPQGEPYPFKVPGGDHVIMKEDFLDHILVVPASDPSLQNSTYRFMQSEIILNQAKSQPDIHNMRFAFEYFYKNMGLSPEDINQLLPAPNQDQPPFSGDPITENQMLLTGKPIAASLPQDHDAHMLVHSLIVSDTNNPPQVQAAAAAHIQEHKALKMLVDMQMQLGFEMPTDPSQIPPEMQNQIAVAAAQVAQQHLQQMQNSAGSPPPQLDPAVVMNEDSIRKADVAMQRIEVDKLKIALEEQKVQTDFALEEMKLKQKEQSDSIKAQLEDKKIELDHLNKEKDQLLKEVQYLRSQQLQNLEGDYNETQM